MSEDMLSKVLVRELPGLMRDFMKKVLGENGQEWIEAFKRFLKKQNPWPETSSKPAKKRLAVLQPLETITEFPKTDIFRAIDHLRITPDNERATAELVIGFLSDNVRNNFLSNGGKIEENLAESKLRAYKLKKDSVDGLIIAELGGEEAAETTVAEMVALMRRQGRGQQGILLTNGYANIFYIRDAKGVLLAVYCCWLSDYGRWYVVANPIKDPGAWRAGDRVFSRDSGS